jgi:hypothetical protein
MPFTLTDTNFANLQRGISADRLKPYLILARGNRWTALQLYRRNTLLSAALYEVLQGYEIVLRNATNEKLAEAYDNPLWWEKAHLRDTERSDIERAISELHTIGREPENGRAVAQVSLGFWTNLYSNYYETSLWFPHLRSIFPITMNRKRLHDRFHQLQLLRNRIAHHEPLKRNPLQEHTDILEAIRWISKTMHNWVSDASRVQAIYDERLARQTPEAKEGANE